MERFKRTAICRFGSWLLAMTVIVTTMAMPSVTAYAATSATFTLYYYQEGMTDEDTLYMDIWNGSLIDFAQTSKTKDVFDWNKQEGVLESVSQNSAWYAIDLTITEGTAGKYPGFDFYKNNSATKVASGTTDIYNQLVSGDYEAYALKDGILYTDLNKAGLTIGEEEDVPTVTVDKTELQALVDSVPEDYKTLGFKDVTVTALENALEAANTVLSKDVATEEIEAAYDALEAAIQNLILVDSDVFVQKIDSVSDNTIRGMDISSYISLMDTFDALNTKYKTTTYGFKDFDGNVLTRQGFFDFLAKCGVNYVRIRVWNNPYDADGKGYGGGNNDLAKAVEMGQYATKAGMKVLIDFHFSDFWADPSKQQAPKAWQNYTVDKKAEAIASYTEASLKELLEAGVDVSMVQIGNETNGSFCGESNWDNLNKLFDAGCDAVHKVATEKGKEILAVLHFTDPQEAGSQEEYARNLASYNDGEGVSYDVFATSYYPYWHGSLSNLKSVLSGIAKTYDKYVMVAETSWANTLEDFDGHENTVREGNNDSGDDLKWTFSNQGQVNEFRDVLASVTDIDVTLASGEKAGLGAFWWEGAWIDVQNVYDEDGNTVDELLNENKALWETYGSGWASSYAKEYDPEDAGKWYGGSAVDNQAFFGADGKALSSIKVYNPNYLKYGTETTVKTDGFTIPKLTVEVSTSADDVTKLITDTKITITYNDKTTKEEAVTWNEADIRQVIEAVKTSDGIGVYYVKGVLSSESSYQVKCIVNVVPVNLLVDSSFEQSKGATTENWTVLGNGFDTQASDPRTGNGSAHYYNETAAIDCSISQKVTVTEVGKYAAYIYAQGDTKSKVTVSITVGDTVYEGEETQLQGWEDWQQPSVTDVVVTKDMLKDGKTDLIFSVHVTGDAASWGSLDDAYLYCKEVLKEETPTPTPETPKTEEKPAAVGTKLDVTEGTFKVTNQTGSNAEVEFSAPKSTTTKKVVIPDTIEKNGVTYKVTSVAASAFKNNKTITSVTLGSNIETIEKNAFNGCTKLKTVKLNNTVVTIGDSAFSGCTSLTKITIPANVTTIGKNVFKGDKKLKTITIKSTKIKKVGAKAFKGIKSNATIKVPSKKLKAYTKLFKGKGQAATVKIKK